MGEPINENTMNLSDENLANEVDSLMGMVVHGEEEAHSLYNSYAIRIGFSIRRSRKRPGADGILRQREFCCSKEGEKYDKDNSTKQRQTLETRTGCKAMVRFSIEDGKWTITKFISAHNHELALPSEAHMLRSNRKLTSSQKNVIDSMMDAGLRSIDTFSYLSKEAGGDEHLGFLKRDFYNHVNQRRESLIEAGDAQSLVNHFKQCQAEDGMFFYTIKVDEESRMTGVFWRDGRSMIDYDCFGDVVVFDTTFCTNQFNLICAPIVGVNHHRKNVMFGCAFLSNEGTSSFIWLFKSFLESMGNKAPKTIFTDQDLAMNNAISAVFPESRHRLCLWHISQNAPKHLGSSKLQRKKTNSKTNISNSSMEMELHTPLQLINMPTTMHNQMSSSVLSLPLTAPHQMANQGITIPNVSFTHMMQNINSLEFSQDPYSFVMNIPDKI